MDPSEFERTLHEGGYTEVGTRSLSPRHATQPHAHGFDVRALVIDGEIALTVGDKVERYTAGQIFTMASGCEHAETVGPDGVTTISGRKIYACLK